MELILFCRNTVAVGRRARLLAGTAGTLVIINPTYAAVHPTRDWCVSVPYLVGYGVREYLSLLLVLSRVANAFGRGSVPLSYRTL